MRRRELFKVVDLFAGPGGLGEGFSALGFDAHKPHFKIALSIEKDPSAHSTLMLRSFYRQFPTDDVPNKYWDYVRGDITKKELFELFPSQSRAAAAEAQCIELGKTPYFKVRELIKRRLDGSKKWVLVGGPPCQAYSLVGRSRMRSTNPSFESDERHFLYREYLRVIADHKPPVFVMENVKGMLSSEHSGRKIISKILSDLRHPGKAVYGRNSSHGYRLFSLTSGKMPNLDEAEDFLVRAEQFGIPQARHRVLILGVRDDFDVTPETLTSSKGVSIFQAINDLPKIRSSVSKEFDCLENWREAIGSITQQRWYVREKIGMLSSVVQKMDTALERIRSRSLNTGAETLAYDNQPKIYSNWYRSGCNSYILNHSGRGHMRGDLHRYLFASSFASIEHRSVHLSDFPSALLPTHKNVNGGVVANHFSDRFRVQVRDRASTTITSHISKDGHYYIHYDPAQCRSLTVREAARLQTFPDSYKFEGNRTSQYHQVGNAVPPLLSMQVAEIVSDILARIRV